MENAEIIRIAKTKAKAWLNEAYDENTRKEVERMLAAPDTTELVDSFYNDLEFGTGGLRGIMGAGTNRMNRYTVGAATQGFANYINRMFPNEEKSVCIGHDCRHHSREYAETAAAIFSANGITAYLFESLRPTPEMSFAIRELGCKGGVIITASHNPKEYNGYKAYWDDGSQLVPPHDKNVIGEVKQVKVEDIKFTAVPALIKTLGQDFDKKYLDRVKTLSLSPEAIRHQHDLKIVFTPLHGTTYKLVPDSLRNWGFTNITTVPEQMVTDGDFPTVASANPEEPAAFKMALDKAREIDADLAMACDPDGDRIGIATKDDRGEWILLNGNQTNIIFTWYIIRRRRELGLMKGNEYTGKTIVTSELIKEIAEKNGIPCYDVYTGFKWIADMIRKRNRRLGKRQWQEPVWYPERHLCRIRILPGKNGLYRAQGLDRRRGNQGNDEPVPPPYAGKHQWEQNSHQKRLRRIERDQPPNRRGPLHGFPDHQRCLAILPGRRLQN